MNGDIRYRGYNNSTRHGRDLCNRNSSSAFFGVIHVKTESCTVQVGPALKQYFLAKREDTSDENEIGS